MDLLQRLKNMVEKHLIVDDNILGKVLHKIKMVIYIKKYDDTNVLIETDDKLPDDITLKNVVILIKCALKDGGKFYPQMSLEETLAA